MCTPTARDSYERLSLAGQALPPGFPSPFLFPDGLSSIETLLTNIQVRLGFSEENTEQPQAAVVQSAVAANILRLSCLVFVVTRR